MLTFTAGECLDMIRYGKFTFLTLSVQLPKSKAVTIIPPAPYFITTPAFETVFTLRTSYLIITESYNWGSTSRPNKVYYEIHQRGWPFPAAISRMSAPEYREGFFCGSHIKECDLENQTHLFCGEDFSLKLWNATGDKKLFAVPEDVHVEFAIWFYTFHKKYFNDVFGILTRTWNLLQTIIDLTRKSIAFDAGELPSSELEEIIEKAKEKPEEEPGAITYG